MDKKELHPSVQQFKEFIRTHPHLIQSVRNGENSWQELYEDWYLLGEDDPKWGTAKGKEGESQTKSDSKIGMSQIMGILKNIDVNQVQNQMQQLSHAIGAIQGVIGQFQGQESQKQQESPPHPFSFRKD